MVRRLTFSPDKTDNDNNCFGSHGTLYYFHFVADMRLTDDVLKAGLDGHGPHLDLYCTFDTLFYRGLAVYQHTELKVLVFIVYIHL